MAKLELEGLGYAYLGGQAVFENVTARVQPGEFVSVIGPSGCGKSTLISLLAGLIQPTSGRVLMDGEPITSPDVRRAVVFQEYSIFPWMRARDNVAFAARQADKGLSRNEANRLADEYLSKVGLDGLGRRYPSQLSGGQRQRVAMARALAMQSEVLLFDEPFGAADPSTRIRLQALLLECWAGRSPRSSVVFVTHDIEEAVLLSDRVLYLCCGGVRQSLQIKLPRPRSRDMLTSPAGVSARDALLNLFTVNARKGGDVV